MMNKLAPLLKTGIQRVTATRSMGGHGVPAHFKPLRQICEENKSHMNFMPVPSGSWQLAYQAKNRYYNTLLIGSLVSVVATFGMLMSTGCIYLHGAPPGYTNKKK